MAEPGQIPRPAQLKGLHFVQTRNHLLTAIGLCTIAVSVMYWVNRGRKQRYIEFYAYVLCVLVRLAKY